MLITMLVEFGGACYLAWRYCCRRPIVLVIIALLCLGTFQFAEYHICQDSALSSLTLARIGHIAITILPPLGVSLAMSIAGKHYRTLERLMYLCCGIFIYFYGFVSGAITSQACLGNYVIFTGGYRYAGPLYAVYYFSLLLLGTSLAFAWSRQTKNVCTRRALLALTVGYLVFIIPTIVVTLANPATINGIPSIMCGFAVFLALSILLAIVPNCQVPTRRLQAENKKQPPETI